MADESSGQVNHICAIGDFDAVCLSKDQIDNLKRTEAPHTRGTVGYGYEEQVRHRVESVLFPTKRRGSTIQSTLGPLVTETNQLYNAMAKISRKLELEFKYTYYLPLIKIEELETDFFEEREVATKDTPEKRRRIRLRGEEKQGGHF